METALDTTARASAPWPAPLRRAPAGAPGTARLRAWLEAGLHDGRAGALEASQPVALADGSGAVHWWTEHDGRPASHALARAVTVEAAGRRLALGMIGLVYTDPALRGRGLASRVVRAAADHLAAGGAAVAALWSDRPDFYHRLGFAPGGRERHLRIEHEALRAALAAAPDAPAARVGAPAPDDAAACEALYAAGAVRVARPPGELARALASPGGRVALARRGGRLEAYAAEGRGDDFPDVVHEWAGSPDGVLACLAALGEGPGEQEVLASPAEDETGFRLRAAGARVLEGPFALLRLLDPASAWSALAAGCAPLAAASLDRDASGHLVLAGPGGRARLAAEEALALLFGPRLPAAARGALGDAGWRAAREILPWPLFVWGFDSI